MKSINLIPAPRRAARRRRAHLRRCTAACCAWAALSVAATVASHAVWHDRQPQSAERLAKVSQEMEQTERAIAHVRAKLASAQSTLRANQAITTQPDWSIVLALLGKQAKGDIVLKTCNVRPATGTRGVLVSPPRPDQRRPTARQTGDGPAQPEAPPYLLETSGLASSHAAANQFILRLEQTGLFSKVTLLETAREAFLDGNKVAFRVECTFDQSPMGATDARAAARAGKAGGTAAASGSEGP